MRPFSFSCVLLLSLAAFSAPLSAQNRKADRQAEVQQLITSGRYQFNARSAQSMNGRTRQLTSPYDLKVTPDTVTAYLPYFGRAYTAPIDPSKGGIDFTSTKFQYNVGDQKKGGWTVTIKPGDTRDVQQMTLTVSADGYASLNVTSTQRQPISFMGVVAKTR